MGASSSTISGFKLAATSDFKVRKATIGAGKSQTISAMLAVISQ